VVLGSIQRGGSPTAFDRMLATRFGIHAVDMVHAGKFNCIAALHGTAIIETPVAEAIRGTRPVDPKVYETAKVFFG
jgi:6-phosphofructokinase 1